MASDLNPETTVRGPLVRALALAFSLVTLTAGSVYWLEARLQTVIQTQLQGYVTVERFQSWQIEEQKAQAQFRRELLETLQAINSKLR